MVNEHAVFIDTNILVYANLKLSPRQVYDIHQLLTHNTDDFSRFSQIITVLPLIELTDDSEEQSTP